MNEQPDAVPDGRPAPLTRPARCTACGTKVPAGTNAYQQPGGGAVLCLSCPDPDPAPINGTAGRSARREHLRRSEQHRRNVRAAHPILGRLLLAAGRDPADVQSWQSGAYGEQVLGAHLDRLTGHGVRLLHDRRIPGSPANIDHIAITGNGIWVIDAKRYRGRPARRTVNGRERSTTLFVGTRNCSHLLGSLRWQQRHITTALPDRHRNVPVRGMLCFIDANWSVFGGKLTIDDIAIVRPQKATRLLTAAGTLTDDEVAALHRTLGMRFPAA